MSLTVFRPNAAEAISLDFAEGKGIAAEVDATIRQLAKKLVSPSSAISRPETRQAPTSTEDKLERFSADFKVYLSGVWMHLPEGWQERLSSQIDSLVDPEEWDKDDTIPDPNSSRTLIRLLIATKAHKRPGLGVSPLGNIVAAWSTETDRLTVECMADDHIKWVLTKNTNGQIERAAGEGRIQRLSAVLRPYDFAAWF
nr:hypothetical protein [uncultured Shinella sp.]